MRNDNIKKRGYVETIWGAKISIENLGGYKERHSNLLVELFDHGLNILQSNKDNNERARILKPVFYGAGKAQFCDPFTKQELYRQLGIPEEVQDGRAMGTYIEYLALVYSCPYVIEEFGEDRACVKFSRDNFLSIIDMGNGEKEYLLCWAAYLNGAVKTLLLPAWTVTVEDKPEDGIVEISILKRVDRQQ